MTNSMQTLQRTLLSAILCTIWAAASVAGNPKNVIELYASQGCSFCPRAQTVLKTFVDRPDIIALTLNVDYWDYLGWKDTLGKAAHSQRQRAYAHARGDGEIYTPQIVANGLSVAVGTDRFQIERAITESAQQLAGDRVTLELRSDKTSFTIKVGRGASPNKPATIYVATVSPTVTVNIKGGENRGRQITFHNVVRNISPVGMWSGELIAIRLLKQDLLQGGGERCVVLVQSADAGPVLAADWMPH